MLNGVLLLKRSVLMTLGQWCSISLANKPLVYSKQIRQFHAERTEDHVLPEHWAQKNHSMETKNVCHSIMIFTKGKCLMDLTDLSKERSSF